MSKLYAQNTVDTEEKSKIFLDHLAEFNEMLQGQIIEQELKRLLDEGTLEVYENLF